MCDSDSLVFVTDNKIQKLESIIEDAGKVPVYVMFYSPMCGYCKKFMPIFNQYRKNCKEGQAVTVIVDVTTPGSKEVFTHYGVTAFPEVMVFKNGSKVRHIIGADEAKLKEAMETLSGISI